MIRGSDGVGSLAFERPGVVGWAYWTVCPSDPRLDVSLNFGHREWGISYNHTIRGEPDGRTAVQ